MTNAPQKIETPFNEEFCTQLEYRICYELEKSTDPELKGFWCDGVSWFPTENQLTKKNVNDKRKIETKAWIGKTGQTEFKATVHFGKKALSKYAKGMELSVLITPRNIFKTKLSSSFSIPAPFLPGARS